MRSRTTRMMSNDADDTNATVTEAGSHLAEDDR